MAATRALVEYGIQNCESDYICHICPKVGMAYLFPTESGKRAGRNRRYGERSASQPGVKGVTAKGKLTPCDSDALPGLAEIPIPADVLQTVHDSVSRYDPESPAFTEAKGKLAEWAFDEMKMRGLFDKHTDNVVPDKAQQLRGIDKQQPTFQVKCDWDGGRRELGGTGNLYLQTHERNVLKLGHSY